MYFNFLTFRITDFQSLFERDIMPVSSGFHLSMAWRVLCCEWHADSESSCWRNDWVATDSGWGSHLLKVGGRLLTECYIGRKSGAGLSSEQDDKSFNLTDRVVWGTWTVQELIASQEEWISRSYPL
jgi:hypothetical protein